MAKKGKEKNTVNKAKHSKLMRQKNNKIKLEKEQHKASLKELIRKMNEKKKRGLRIYRNQ